MPDTNATTLSELQLVNQRLAAEHAEQRRILEAINTINQIVINSTSLDGMLDKLMEEFLNLFDCQRAWLLYPCDPSSKFTTVPKEKTRKEWPGAGIDNIEIPTDDYTSKVFASALDSDGPVAYDTEKQSASSVTNDHFGVKSMMVFAIHPKVDQPWLLGIHHCGKERIYSDKDIELFQSLGARIADGLSSILSLQKTQQSEALQRALLNNTNAAISIKDLDGNYLLTNDYFNKVFNQHQVELQGNNVHALFPDDISDQVDNNHLQVVQQQKSLEFEEELPTTDGTKTFLSVRSPIFSNNNEVNAICTISTDITARRLIEEKINHLAHFDHLTQLPNRLSIDKELARALDKSRSSQHYGALIFVDLDNFKTLNDTKGHSYGDMLLKEASELLKKCVRDNDIVARFGGDEFLIILSDLDHHEQRAIEEVTQVADRALSALETVFVGDDFQHHVTASIGITLFNGEQPTPGELLKRVDAAMYLAKNSGRNNIKFFDPSLQRQLEYKVQISSEIIDGVFNGEFELYYQPQVDHHGKITGAEALIRWNHPEKGMISPGDFIPLAEENDSIIELGNWVLHQGCKQLLKWQNDAVLSQLHLSINVSAKQFHQEGFLDSVQQIISSTPAPTDKIKIELTESLDQQDVEGNILKMNALRAMGMSISMDDFGTGYSSLNCLRRLPLNQLKIDQSFVRDISHDASSDIIIKTIIGMANNLDIDVIAEGVETAQQSEFLQQNGCNHYQGYLFGKPMPISKFEKMALENERLLTKDVKDSCQVSA